MENVVAEKDMSGRQVGGLTAEQIEAIKQIVWGVPDSLEDLVPGRLATTGEPVLIAAKPGEKAREIESKVAEASDSFQVGEALLTVGAPIMRQGGWKSRKLLVLLVTMGGLFAQLPLGTALPPTSQLVNGCLAALYLLIQGYLDHAAISPCKVPEAGN